MPSATNFLSDNKARKYGVLGGGAATVALVSQPAMAQTANASITEVSDTIGLLAGVGGAAATVAITVMGVRLAIKQVNRATVKG